MASPRFITAAEVEGGVIPPGGATDQVLAKESNADFDLKWTTGGGGGGEATLELTSTGDNTDQTTFTADNSGIKQLDVNGVEMFRIWADGLFGGNTLIIDKLPDGFIAAEATDNVFVGSNIASNIAPGVNSNIAIGNSALQDLTNGAGNVGLGQSAGAGIIEGTGNTVVGSSVTIVDDASDTTIIGGGAAALAGVTENGIAIGAQAEVTSNNTAVIGNSDITDVYFGSVTGASKLHGKGDAIVFPDADPHVAGAAYWVGGVLTKSNG